MSLARRSSRGPRYLAQLRAHLRWPSLSRQTLYQWESGKARVPASALVIGAAIAELTVDELLDRARRLIALGLSPGS